MNYLTLAKSWLTSRLAERTSWDGGVIIAVSILALLASPLIKFAAWGGLAYGAWTLYKEETK
jgi:hypothetical protein|tara:strand:+ start:14835 stop:15020 length:186 start_codon:yes stop_codon:yes gene_type:complete